MNPKPATPPFTLPPIFSAVRNGMKIYVVPRAGLPLVSLHLIFPYGAETDPPGKAGLTDLAAEMLTLGTRQRSAAQIASEVDGLGASLSAHAGWDATALHLQGLKEDLGRLLELLREMVVEPSFPEEEFSQLQQRRVAALVQQKDESQIVAGERFEEILFRGTPYDHPVYGTLKTVPLISRDEVQDFYRRRSLPEGSFWVLVGDVDPDDCFRRLEAHFSILTPGPIQASPFNPAPPQGIRTFLVDRPDLTQSQIRLGHLGFPPVHPDFYAFEVMNYILGGGGFSSRLMQRIRVELGLTYGIRSSLDLRRQAGPFAVATFTPTATTFGCVAESLSILKSFRAQGASKIERDEAVQFLRGSYPLKFETLSQVAQRVLQTEIYGLGIDFLRDYPEKIEATGEADILRCAQTHLDPENLIIVIVGRAEAFRRDFERWGPVEVSK
jgi:zinc protease